MASSWPSVSGSHIWPDEKTDYMEGRLYEQFGLSNDNVVDEIINCKGATDDIGRSFGAEWLRNAYHDMATADIHAGTGGIDASIYYEMDRDENKGKAFNETFDSFKGMFTSRGSMADFVALAATVTLGACSNGSIILPFRAGRVDATGPGPTGVPEPQQDIETHTQIFARQGFNASEMIALVACGHSIGGVHGVDFPEIVPVHNNTVRLP
jgi:catalase (peroxidase I)